MVGVVVHENILDKQKPYFGGKSQEELSLRVAQGWGEEAGQWAGRNQGGVLAEVWENS